MKYIILRKDHKHDYEIWNIQNEDSSKRVCGIKVYDDLASAKADVDCFLKNYDPNDCTKKCVIMEYRPVFESYWENRLIQIEL